MAITDIITLIIGIGGLQGLIELARWWRSRKTQDRRDAAEAKSSEFKVLQDITEFLQSQLKEKEERFAEQTALVRQQNRELLEAERKISELSIELANVRCDDKKCPFRQPPNAHTPPPPDMSKEEWHLNRNK